jgi:hypothetical protein
MRVKVSAHSPGPRPKRIQTSYSCRSRLRCGFCPRESLQPNPSGFTCLPQTLCICGERAGGGGPLGAPPPAISKQSVSKRFQPCQHNVSHGVWNRWSWLRNGTEDRLVQCSFTPPTNTIKHDCRALLTRGFVIRGVSRLCIRYIFLPASRSRNWVHVCQMRVVLTGCCVSFIGMAALQSSICEAVHIE